jgi:hypothetical protein
MEALLFIAAFWVAPIVVGHRIGTRKNRAGWAWGLLLGWVGVIIVACLSNKNAEHTALSEKQRQVAELEAEVRLAELRKRQAALEAPPADRATEPVVAATSSPVAPQAAAGADPVDAPKGPLLIPQAAAGRENAHGLRGAAGPALGGVAAGAAAGYLLANAGDAQAATSPLAEGPVETSFHETMSGPDGETITVEGTLTENVQVEDGVAHVDGTMHETVTMDGQTYEFSDTYEQSVDLDTAGGGGGGFFQALGDLFG